MMLRKRTNKALIKTSLFISAMKKSVAGKELLRQKAEGWDAESAKFFSLKDRWNE
jgi:hypothetical protein